MVPKLPRHAKRFPPEPGSAQQVFLHLERFHGIAPALASERLHIIKEKLGYKADDNVIFDFTGNVFDPRTLELLGSMTEGGAKRK
jgi:hypothetical protein